MKVKRRRTNRSLTCEKAYFAVDSQRKSSSTSEKLYAKSEPFVDAL